MLGGRAGEKCPGGRLHLNAGELKALNSPGRTHITCWTVIPFTSAESIGHTACRRIYPTRRLHKCMRCKKCSKLREVQLYENNGCSMRVVYIESV